AQASCRSTLTVGSPEAILVSSARRTRRNTNRTASVGRTRIGCSSIRHLARAKRTAPLLFHPAAHQPRTHTAAQPRWRKHMTGSSPFYRIRGGVVEMSPFRLISGARVELRDATGLLVEPVDCVLTDESGVFSMILEDAYLMRVFPTGAAELELYVFR